MSTATIIQALRRGLIAAYQTMDQVMTAPAAEPYSQTQLSSWFDLAAATGLTGAAIISLHQKIALFEPSTG